MFTREFMTQLKERGVDQGHIININRYKTTPFHSLQMQFLILAACARVTVLALSFSRRSFIHSVHRAAEISDRFYALVR